MHVIRQVSKKKKIHKSKTKKYPKQKQNKKNPTQTKKPPNQTKNPKKKKKENEKEKLNTWDFYFAAVLDTHKVMDIKQFIFTASLLVHLFLGCLKHLNTNKRSVAKIMKANSR